jgi:hypothetical protein
MGVYHDDLSNYKRKIDEDIRSIPPKADTISTPDTPHTPVKHSQKYNSNPHPAPQRTPNAPA